MRFLKIEGAGNDYVLVDAFEQRVADPAGLSRRVSDRHRGIGSDGLIVLEPAGTGAAARMRMFNADGSEGAMCGNGLRCVVRYLVESGRAAGPLVRVETAAGPRRGRLVAAGTVELEMGVPDVQPRAVPVLLPGDGQEPPEHPLPDGLAADPPVAFAVSVGNPHLVVRVADPAAVDLARHGRALETSALCPAGANVHFVRLESPSLVLARTWERGSGATLACGTGAVAVAEIARRLGWTAAGPVTVRMPGGDLGVRWDPDGMAWLTGPGRVVFHGEWPDP